MYPYYGPCDIKRDIQTHIQTDKHYSFVYIDKKSFQKIYIIVDNEEIKLMGRDFFISFNMKFK